MDTRPAAPLLTKDRLRSIEEPEALECILNSQPSEATLYHLTFHAAFAVKLFDVMRREGPNIQGFDRMQQSFRQSVELLRESLASFPEECRPVLGRFLGSSHDSQAKLMRLVRDLARYKNWMLEASDTTKDV